MPISTKLAYISWGDIEITTEECDLTFLETSEFEKLTSNYLPGPQISDKVYCYLKPAVLWFRLIFFYTNQITLANNATCFP